MIGAIVLISRIFAVLAATAFVGTCSLVLLAPPEMDLLHAFGALDPALLQRVPRAGHALLGDVFWRWAAVPVLMRPAWLVPAALAMICAGASVSFAPPGEPPWRSRRSG